MNPCVVHVLLAVLLQVSEGCGVWAGALQSHSVEFRVVQCASQPFSLKKKAGDALVFSTEAQSDFQSIKVDGLDPDTEYEYQVAGIRGRFKTFPAPGQKSGFRFMFGSCSATGSRSKIFSLISKFRPGFFLHLGDLHYADISENNVGLFDKEYERIFENEVISSAFRSTALAYVWDDHDFGPNNADKNSGTKEAASLSYRKNFPHYPLAAYNASFENPTSPSSFLPIYQAFSVGSMIRFIMMDLRSEADNLDGPLMSMEQRNWICKELKNNHLNHEIVVLVSPIAWIGAAETAPESDGWPSDPLTRSFISNCISESNIKNVVMIEGDSHSAAADDGSNSDYRNTTAISGAGFPIFRASPLDKFGSSKGGPYSQGCKGYRFWPNSHIGLVDVSFPSGGKVCIAFKALNSDQDVVVSFDSCSPFVKVGSAGAATCSLPALPSSAIALITFTLLTGILCVTVLPCVVFRKTLSRVRKAVFIFCVLLLMLLLALLGYFRVTTLPVVLVTSLCIFSVLLVMLPLAVYAWTRLSVHARAQKHSEVVELR